MCWQKTKMEEDETTRHYGTTNTILGEICCNVEIMLMMRNQTIMQYVDLLLAHHHMDMNIIIVLYVGTF